MLLSQKRFDERAYYDYVERLISQGIDVSRLRIFETYTVNQKVYSVVYGEFPSRGRPAPQRWGYRKFCRKLPRFRAVSADS